MNGGGNSPPHYLNGGQMIDRTLSGKRIEFIGSSDQYTMLKSGDEGTIKFTIVDEVTWLETVCIEWDNGSSLSLIDGQDKFLVHPNDTIVTSV